MVMQSKQALHILPLALVGCYACSALRHGVGNELVYDAETFCFVEGLSVKSFPGVFGRGGGSNAVDPVMDSVEL
jgi:hypothetical protein